MKSVVSYPDRGKYGNNRYRGNCSGWLIKDLIDQYNIKGLSDYMVGSGTTEDVCNETGVPGTFLDLNRGFDMMTMDIPERPQNLFWHPPYGGMIIYSDQMYKAQDIINQYGFDPRVNDLSRARNWDDFIKKMNYCMLKQFSSLEKGGRMFVLMGDWKQKGRLYSMLCDIAKPGTLEQILVKMEHNCKSDSRNYANTNFVPICHEYVMVVRKDAATIIPISMAKKYSLDVRDVSTPIWRDVIAAVMEDEGKPLPLQELYQRIEGHKRCASNSHWKEKVRQTLQRYDLFSQTQDGSWKIGCSYHG